MGLTKYQIKKIRMNLQHFYDQAGAHDIANGVDWYPQFQRWCCEVANKYMTNNEVVANVFSALSPRNRLHTNMQDTITVFDAVGIGISADDVRVSTYHSNKRKAFDIATGKRTILPKSLKTYAFVQNIAYLNSDYVTIDVWHMRACFDRMIVPKSLTPIIYEQIQELTIKQANKNGLTGYEFQAIIWESIRK